MNNSIHTIINLIRDYKWKSLFFNYWKMCLIFVMIPFIIIYFLIFSFYDNSNKAKNALLDTQIFYQSKSSVDNIFGNLNNFHRRLSVNTNVIQYLNCTNVQSISPNDIATILSTINEYTYYSKNIDSIFLYSFKSNYVLSTRNSNSLSSFYDTTWYNQYAATSLDCFSIYSPSRYYNMVPDVLSNCYGIYNGSELTGLLVFNINISELINSFNYDDESNILLFDQNQKSVYQKFKINTHVLYELNNTPVQNGSIRSFEKENIFCVTSKLDNSNMTMAITKPLRNIRMPIIIMILVILAAFFIPFMISLYLSGVFYSSIAKIATNLQLISSDEFTVGREYNELLSINRNILKMISKTENIESELSQKMIDLNRAQTIAMQTQMNPHFLFNTLNLISVLSMGLSKTDRRLENVIALLSDLLAEALDTKNILVTIRDEISYVKKYIQIAEIKECNNFTTEWNIDESLLDYKIIKLLLQPLVENAFEHGLKYKDENEEKNLKISIQENKGDVHISIIDNGPQINPSKLHELNDQLNNSEISESSNIGLKNVNKRIKLIFGENYGCSIESSVEGTTANIKIPKT